MNVKCINICSSAHAGSTLLDFMLGSHPMIESLGEIWHLPKNISLNSECSCGELLLSCETWKRDLAALNQHFEVDFMETPYAVDFGPFQATHTKDQYSSSRAWLLRRKIILGAYYLKIIFAGSAMPTKKFSRCMRNTMELFQIIANNRNKQVVVDTTKSYLKALALHAMYPDRAIVISIVRDGRAVLYSCLKRGESREQAVSKWLNANRRSIPLLKKYVASESLISLKYEDFVTDPETALREICNKSNIPYNEAMLSPGLGVWHTVNGNRQVKNTISGGVQLREDWKDGLDENDLRYFNKVAGKFNRSLGYGS